jgi:hypothetical protein
MDDIDDYLELLEDGFKIVDVIGFIEKEYKIKCIKIKNKTKLKGGKLKNKYIEY